MKIQHTENSFNIHSVAKILVKPALLCLALGFFSSCLIHAQNLSFNSLLEGVNNPADNALQEELKKNNFRLVSPYKNRFNPEKWALNYNPGNGAAMAWVNTYFNPAVLEKKRSRMVTVDITVRTFGKENQLHTFLTGQIKGNCKYGGTFTEHTEGYWYEEYVHESGAYFQVFSMKGENYIKVRNTIKIEPKN